MSSVGLDSTSSTEVFLGARLVSRLPVLRQSCVQCGGCGSIGMARATSQNLPSFAAFNGGHGALAQLVCADHFHFTRHRWLDQMLVA
jgi:hypothetical protein